MVSIHPLGCRWSCFPGQSLLVALSCVGSPLYGTLIHIVITANMFCPILSYDRSGNPSRVLLVCASGLYERHMTRWICSFKPSCTVGSTWFLFLTAPWGLDWVDQYIILFCKLSLTVLWFSYIPIEVLVQFLAFQFLLIRSWLWLVIAGCWPMSPWLTYPCGGLHILVKGFGCPCPLLGRLPGFLPLAWLLLPIIDFGILAVFLCLILPILLVSSSSSVLSWGLVWGCWKWIFLLLC